MVELLVGIKIINMKLNNKKRDRLNEYWEMLQFNCDCISYFKEGEPQMFCEMIEDIVKSGVYYKKQTLMLRRLEGVYQHLNKLKKFTK